MSKLWPKYENWSKQENQNRLYRYKLAKNDQNRNCTGTSSICTGKSLRKVPRRCIFSHFHALFHHKPNLYFIYTSKSFQIHLMISFLLTSSFNYISFFKLFMNHFKNHSNMGYNPYTIQSQGFVRVYSKP